MSFCSERKLDCDKCSYSSAQECISLATNLELISLLKGLFAGIPACLPPLRACHKLQNEGSAIAVLLMVGCQLGIFLFIGSNSEIASCSAISYQPFEISRVKPVRRSWNRGLM